MIVHKLKADAEASTPYQHSSSRVGAWAYNENFDVDLRENFQMNSQQLNEQRKEAFLKALEKINEFFKAIPEKEKGVKFDHQQFHVTIVDEVFQLATHGAVTTAWYPVEMEGTVDLKIRHNTEVQYGIHLDIDNPKSPMGDLQGPHGPHIGYHMTGAKDFFTKYGLTPKVTGHILLNRAGNEHLPDRARGQTFNNQTHANYVPIARLFSTPVSDSSVLERFDVDIRPSDTAETILQKRIQQKAIQTQNKIYPLFF